MDLAEFLRQYAEHHGHRTGSGSQIEVNEMPGSGKVGGSKTRTPLSRPEGTALDQRANSPRPGEAAGGKFTTPEMGGLSPRQPRRGQARRVRITCLAVVVAMGSQRRRVMRWAWGSGSLVEELENWMRERRSGWTR